MAIKLMAIIASPIYIVQYTGIKWLFSVGKPKQEENRGEIEREREREEAELCMRYLLRRDG